jgi:SAM-dependent methyltransferase
MQLDAARLRDFYRTPLGQLVRRQLVAQIRQRWTSVAGLTVMGAGFATPYLGSFRTEAARTGCLMPARQGALVWPPGGKCHSLLVEEHHWPLPDNSVDRLLAVHMIEAAERVGPVLREMWRVLAPDGRVMLIVPNRTGVWSRIDTTPFGQGLPFSHSQLAQYLSDALLTPIGWGGALFFPPVSNRLALRIAPALERTGTRLSRGLGGVMIVEARKDLMAPISGGIRAQTVPVFRPASSFGRVMPAQDADTGA